MVKHFCLTLCFNPRPPFRGDATQQSINMDHPMVVSILVPRFGGTLQQDQREVERAVVVSILVPRFGGTLLYEYRIGQFGGCFNPRPPFRGDATRKDWMWENSRTVSILVPRFGGTLLGARAQSSANTAFQSSSPVSGGRYRVRFLAVVGRGSFNPRPPFRGDATRA